MVPAPRPGTQLAVQAGSAGGAGVPGGAMTASPPWTSSCTWRELAQNTSPLLTFGSGVAWLYCFRSAVAIISTGVLGAIGVPIASG